MSYYLQRTYISCTNSVLNRSNIMIYMIWLISHKFGTFITSTCKIWNILWLWWHLIIIFIIIWGTCKHPKTPKNTVFGLFLEVYGSPHRLYGLYVRVVVVKTPCFWRDTKTVLGTNFWPNFCTISDFQKFLTLSLHDICPKTWNFGHFHGFRDFDDHENHEI